MSATATLADLAVFLDRSYDWTQKHWRKIEGLPPPYVGGEPRGRPSWWVADLTAWKAGTRWPTGAGEARAVHPPSPAPFPANETTPAPPPRDVDRRVAALLG